MVEKAAKPKSSAWKWMAGGAVLGVLVQRLMDWLWPYSPKFGYTLRQVYELVDALLIPVNFIRLIWRNLVGADFPSFFYDFFLYEASNAVIYALFGYLLWRVTARDWRGCAVFGSILGAFWAVLIGVAIVVGVTTGHTDGVYEKIIPAKLSRDMVQKIQEEGISAKELADLAGEPDCRLERKDGEILVYRALTQRRYENYLFFFTTKIRYLAWERLDFIHLENGVVAKQFHRREMSKGKAKDIKFDCDSLDLE